MSDVDMPDSCVTAGTRRANFFRKFGITLACVWTAHAFAAGTGSGTTPVVPGINTGNAQGAPVPVAPGSDANAQTIARGRYVALAADCAACHTAPRGGKPFAGGYPLETPFGKLIASNITFDKATGIGTWTEQEFTRAVRAGKGKHGENLYPAMPYNDYVKISDEDMRDLWAYMRTVQPVSNKVISNQLPFPFDIRMVMFGWNLLFFDKTSFKSIAGQPAAVNRGAYLVQSVGHCAACHTPKNVFGGDKHDAFLQGGDLAGWHAPEITSDKYVGIGGWNEADIAEYLKTGSNTVAIASGPMAEAVTNSTQHLTDNDRLAIAAYLKTLPASSLTRPDALSADNAQMQLGGRVYRANCAACHASNGSGISGIATRFPGNPGIQAPGAAGLLTTVLMGGRGAVTQSNPTSAAMPGFAWKLTDAQIAAVLTYSRNSWGNAAASVSVNEVEAARKQSGARARLLSMP